MKARELWKWIVENNLEDEEVYVNENGEYKEISMLWESEKNGKSVIIECSENPEK